MSRGVEERITDDDDVSSGGDHGGGGSPAVIAYGNGATVRHTDVSQYVDGGRFVSQMSDPFDQRVARRWCRYDASVEMSGDESSIESNVLPRADAADAAVVRPALLTSSKFE